MPTSFAITAAAPTVSLSADRAGTATFTVSNTSGVPQRGRARPVAADPATAGWLSLDGPAERDFPIEGTEQLVVRISIPPATPAGAFRFRLDIVSEQNPDEQSVEGPSVSIDVPAPAARPRRFPWWAIAAPAAVLLLGAGFFAFRGGDDDNVEATPPPVDDTLFPPDDGDPPPDDAAAPLAPTRITLDAGEQLDLDRGQVAARGDLEFRDIEIRDASRFRPVGGAVAAPPTGSPQGFDRCAAATKSDSDVRPLRGESFCVDTDGGRVAEVRVVATARRGTDSVTVDFIVFDAA